LVHSTPCIFLPRLSPPRMLPRMPWLPLFPLLRSIIIAVTLAPTSSPSCHVVQSSPVIVTDSLCHACQLGRQNRLPLPSYSSRVVRPFYLILCDLWTSPILDVSSYKYYLVIFDDCTHYSWTFSLRHKSDTFSTLSHFFTSMSTQFGYPHPECPV
jgi:hypothetical protein